MAADDYMFWVAGPEEDPFAIEARDPLASIDCHGEDADVQPLGKAATIAAAKKGPASDVTGAAPSRVR